MNRQRILHLTREVLLTSGAVLGVICILATVAGTAFGVKPLVFLSGSMSPAISTGDLGIARTVDASALRRGDIVSVVNADGNRVTHRVVNSAAQQDARQLRLKGDANKVADSEVYTVTRADKVLFDVPKAGYVVDAAASPGGLFVLGLYVAGMLMLVFRRRDRDDRGVTEPPRPVAERRGGSCRVDTSGRSRSVARSVAPLTTAAILTVAAPASATAWIDPVTASGTTLRTYTVVKPAITSCVVTGLSQKTATITFAAVSSPFALDYTATVLETGQLITINNGGGSRSVAFSAGLLSTVSNATYNVRIQAKLPAPNGSWVSVVANQPVTIGLLGLAMTCGTAS